MKRTELAATIAAGIITKAIEANWGAYDVARIALEIADAIVEIDRRETEKSEG